LKAEVFADDRQQFFIALHTGAESIHAQRDRLALADGIRHLYLTALCKAIGNDVLCDVPAIIRSAAIDLGRILGREATAADPSHSAICITDDLATGRTGVTEAAANDKAAAWI